MLRLQQLVGEGPKCLIDLMRIDPTVNWSKVINNAVSLDYIVGVGYFEGDGRKWKIYDLVSSETRDELKSQVPLGPAPACFTEQAFARWKTEVRDSKDYTTVCMDCDESSSYTKRVRKEGRCHKEVWQDIFFGRKPNRQPANV
jgi:hypothetical protein